jgi:basic amino acid/polyamine antiporter, APA family
MNKNKDTDTGGDVRLKRALGLFTGVLLVIGVMMGSGVYKKIIPMAQSGISGSWILLAWIIPGIITIFGAFILSGLSSLTEESGGVYEYFRLSLGNFFSFLFGWTDYIIIGSASVAALAFIFSQTVNTLIPLPNPFHSLEHISIAGFIFPFADSGIKILSIASIFLLTWVNYRGVEKGGMINNIITSGKVLGILVIIVAGLTYHSPETVINIPAVVKPVETGSLSSGMFISAFFGAMLSALWAYDGWLDISFVTGEIKNPKKNVPLAIFFGVSIAMFLYVSVNYAYMQVMPVDQLARVNKNEIGAAVVAETMLGSAGKIFIAALIMISTFGALNAVILSHSRIYFRMAQENYFFKNAAAVHPKFHTPHVALMYTMVWSIVLVITGTFDMLTDMVIFASFLFNFLLALALIKMKRKGLINEKVIGYPVIPVLMMLFSGALVINTIIIQPKETLTGMCLVLSGVFFYFYFKMKNNSRQEISG